MKTLVVYDSVFGNTEMIAKHIGDSIQGARVVRVTEVNLGDLNDVDCLIVGSPTRAFRPTKDITGFLNKLESKSLQGVKVAAFDTRMSIKDVDNKVLTFMANIFGYADKPIEDKLLKKGGVKAADRAGFIVLDSEGPLKEGEIERASLWAQSIVSPTHLE